MFAGWGSWVARFRWPVLTVALVAVMSSGLWGLGVFGQLSEGGYNDPHSESSHAAVVVQQALGTQAGDVVAIYTPTRGKIGDATLTKLIKFRLSHLPPSAVKSTSSYWQSKSVQYAAKDKSSAVAVITLVGPDDAAKTDQFRAIQNDFAVDGATVQLAGGVPLNDASSTRSTSDLGTAELISLPITLVLLLFIFGSLVAAALPVLVGGLAVLGSLGILHEVASHTEVNSFAVNVASLLGLGMAIDYGLFMVGRFREEQAAGRTPAEAVRRTVGTAGRTVLFSATLLMIALSGLLLFPQGFLNSLAYGGLSAVALAAILSLTLLPALLAVLGPRVDKLPIRLPRRAAAQPAGTVWARMAGFVLRHRVLVALPIVAVLVLLASPMFNVHFGDSDERILPPGDPARVAVQTLKASYPQLANNGVQIVLQGTSSTGAFAAAARAVPGIDELGPVTKTPLGAIMTATLTSSDPYSSSARDAVDGIRDLPVPPGANLLVGGTTARNLDSLHATAAKLPLMVALLAGATLVLMFLAFGSILLPIKAVVMSALSLSATFGVLVWIFDQGHLSGLLNITPAPLEVGIVVLMAAVVFGLSTDYEVFLLSRMVEARTRGASSAEAITTGLARTGRVISAAAVLLIVVTGAFALSAVTTMRFVGVGMIVALLLDATVVRLLLVPAVLGLLGDAAWWAPGPLRRLQQRAGLSEQATEAEYAAESGKHAAPDDTVILTGVAPRRQLPPAPDQSSKSGSTSPVPELLYRDEDRPDWTRPSAAVPALLARVSPIALPAGPADATQVFPAFPAFPVDTSGLSSTVRIELEPADAADETAETVDAELVEGSEGAEDLEATGIITLAADDREEIADAEVVTDADAVPSGEAPVPDDEPAVDETARIVLPDETTDAAIADEVADDGPTAESVDHPSGFGDLLVTASAAGAAGEMGTFAGDVGGALGPAVNQPEPTPEPGADPEPTPEPQPDAGPTPEQHSDADPTPEQHSDADPTPEPQADTAPAPETQTDADPTPEPHADTEPTPQQHSDAESAPELNPEPASEPRADAEPLLEPHADLGPELDPQADLEPEPQADPEPVLEPHADPEPTLEPLADAAPAPEPHADPEPTLADAGPTPEPHADPEPVLETHADGASVADAAPGAGAEPQAEGPPSDTPLFAGTGASSYAALFPELFAPTPEPEPERYTDWSAPVSEDAFFAPPVAEPFLYPREEPATDERYVTQTPADKTAEEHPDPSLAPTADLSSRYAEAHLETPSPEPFTPEPRVEAPEPPPAPPFAPEPVSETPEPRDRPFTPVPVFEAPAPQPTEPPVPGRAFGAPAPSVPEPIFELPEPPAEPRFPSFEPRIPEPAVETRVPDRPPVPDPASRPVPASAAETAARRPADLSEVAAAWRQVIENRRPITDRPADLESYVGQTPRRPATTPEPPRADRPTDQTTDRTTDRPTDLGSYTAARPADPAGWRSGSGGEGRPADLGQYGPGGEMAGPGRRRPETLGDQPPVAPVRRPASLADTVPAVPRRPRDPVPGEGPTRDLSAYAEQEDTHPRA